MFAVWNGQDAASSLACKAFDGLRDARTLGDAVKKGGSVVHACMNFTSDACFHP